MSLGYSYFASSWPYVVFSIHITVGPLSQTVNDMSHWLTSEAGHSAKHLTTYIRLYLFECNV